MEKTTLHTIPKQFYISPNLNNEFLNRSSLISTLDGIFEKKKHFVYISAPGGSGKSLLVSSWFDHLRQTRPDIRLKWISVKPTEQTSIGLQELFINAFSDIFPENQTYPQMEQAKMPPLRGLTPIFNAINKVSQPYVICLDDVHQLKDEVEIEALQVLLQFLPQNVYLVATSRHISQEILQCLGIRSYLHIDSVDLAFKPHEIELLLKKVGDTTPSPKDIEYIQEKSQGWITAIQMILHSIKSSPGNSISDSKDLDQRFKRYFNSLYEALPNEERRILLSAVILREFSIDMLQFIYPEKNLLHFIEKLIRQGFIIEELGQNHNYFRLHALVWESLHTRLPLDTKQWVYEQAAQWCENNGNWREALDYLKSICSFSTPSSNTSEILNRIFQTAICSDYSFLVQETGKLLAYDYYEINPRAFCYFFVSLIFQNDFNSIMQYYPYLSAIRQKEDNWEIKAIEGIFTLFSQGFMQKMLLINDSITIDPKGILQQIQKSRDFAPDSIVYPALLHYCNFCIFYSGDIKQSLKNYRDSIPSEFSDKNRWISYFNITQYQMVLVYSGRLSKAEDSFNQYFYRHKNLSHLELVLQSGITSALLRADFEKTIKRTHLALSYYTDQGMIEKYLCSYFNVYALIASGDLGLAYKALEEFNNTDRRNLAKDSKINILFENYAGFLANYITHKKKPLLTIDNNFQDASLDMCFQSSPFYHIYFYSIRLKILSDDQDILEEIDCAIEKCRKVEANLFRIWLTILKVVALIRKNEIEKGFQLLLYSWEEMKLEELYLPLIMEGDLVMDWLNRSSIDFPKDFPERLIELLRKGDSAQKSKSKRTHIEKVTNREKELLTLVDMGFSNKDISERLSISENTVKWHMNKMFQKLSVKNRVQAVQAAKEYNQI